MIEDVQELITQLSEEISDQITGHARDSTEGGSVALARVDFEKMMQSFGEALSFALQDFRENTNQLLPSPRAVYSVASFLGAVAVSRYQEPVIDVLEDGQISLLWRHETEGSLLAVFHGADEFPYSARFRGRGNRCKGTCAIESDGINEQFGFWLERFFSKGGYSWLPRSSVSGVEDHESSATWSSVIH